MLTLEDEALLYVGIDPDKLVDLGDKRIKAAGHFIAGANSNWVKAEKIKAQIEILNRVYEAEWAHTEAYELIQDLKKQLIELE